MTTTDTAASPTDDQATRSRFTAWPLWITFTGVLSLVALLMESRPVSETKDGRTVTALDAITVDPDVFRISGVLGYLAALSMLLLAALWHQRVSRRFPGSTASHLITFSGIASAALSTMAYGWRGALGDYLPGGPEAGTFDTEGLYNYYVMVDFSPYIAYVPLLGACFGLTWMAFRDRLVSRPLGAAAGGLATLLLAAVIITGVPGLPFVTILGLVVAGIWLAVGRSAITQ